MHLWMPGLLGEREAAAAAGGWWWFVAVQSWGSGAMWSWKGNWLRRTNDGHERRVGLGLGEGATRKLGSMRNSIEFRAAVDWKILGDGRRRGDEMEGNEMMQMRCDE